MPRVKVRTRRRRGQGSIFWHTRLDCWLAILPRALGRRSRQCDTKPEAEAWLKRELARPPEDQATSGTLFGAYLSLWYAAEKHRWTTSTQRTYLFAIQRLAPLHRRPLATIRPSDVDRLTTQLLESGNTVATVKTIRAVLRASLEAAHRDALIPVNPVGRLRTAKRATVPKVIYSPADVAKLRAAAAEHPYELAVVLGVYLGPRIGELVTLQWSDIDAAARTLTIQRSAGQSTRQPNPTTKTGQSRVVRLSGACLAALDRHRARQTVASPWLFPGHDPSRHIGASTMTAALYAMQRQAGVRHAVPHQMFRHTSSSLHHAAGTDDATRAALLGHSSPATTRSTYSHSLPGRQDEAIAALERLLEEPID